MCEWKERQMSVGCEGDSISLISCWDGTIYSQIQTQFESNFVPVVTLPFFTIAPCCTVAEVQSFMFNSPFETSASRLSVADQILSKL